MKNFCSELFDKLRSSSFAGLILLLTLGAGCNSEGSGDGNSGEETAVTQDLTLDGIVEPSSLALAGSTGHKFYCLTFEQTPRSESAELGADGSFSIKVWKGTSFGCFVTDSDGKSIATLIIEDESEDSLHSNTSTSLYLGKSLSLGTMSISSGQLKVPSKTVAAATAEAEPHITIDDLHEKEFYIRCIDTDNEHNNNFCHATVDYDPFIYFRILKGKRGNNDFVGTSMWGSEEKFKACGSVDFEPSEISDVSFSQASSGSFSDTCELTGEDTDGDGTQDANFIPKDRPFLSKVIESGTGYTMFTQYRSFVSADCTMVLDFSFTVQGKETTRLSGLVRSNLHFDGDCSAFPSLLQEKGTAAYSAVFIHIN